MLINNERRQYDKIEKQKSGSVMFLKHDEYNFFFLQLTTMCDICKKYLKHREKLST